MIRVDFKDLLTFADKDKKSNLSHLMVDRGMEGCSDGASIIYQPTIEETEDTYLLNVQTGEKIYKDAIKFTQLINIQYTFAFEVDRFQLQKCCNALQEIAYVRTMTIELELKEKTLILRAESFTLCELKLALNQEVPDFINGFNVSRMLNFLNLINKRFKHSLTSTITVEINQYKTNIGSSVYSTNLKPIQLSYGDLKYLLMPVQLKY